MINIFDIPEAIEEKLDCICKIVEYRKAVTTRSEYFNVEIKLPDQDGIYTLIRDVQCRYSDHSEMHHVTDVRISFDDDMEDICSKILSKAKEYYNDDDDDLIWKERDVK